MPSQNNAANLRDETARLRAERERNERENRAREERAENEAHLNSVQMSVQTLAQARQERELTDARLENWEVRNPAFTSVAVSDIAGYGLWIGSAVGVAFMDNMLLGDAAREIAKGYTKALKSIVGNGEWIILFAIIAFPIAYILMEIAVGYRFGIERKVGQISFLTGAFAVLAWLTLPIIIIGFSLSNSGLLSNDPDKIIGKATLWATIFRVGGSGLTAIVMHGFVLWNGARIAKAISYVVFKIRQILLRRKLNRLNRQIGLATTDVESGFRDYYDGFNNRQTQETEAGETGIKAGPFGARTRQVVNEVFDQEVIEEPSAPTQKDAPQPEAAHHTAAPDNSANRNPQNAANDGNPNTNQSNFVFDMNGEDEVRP